ncbi:glycosyltransferase family 1 protein [Halomonas shantousis]
MRVAIVSETWAPEINGVAHTLGHLAEYLLEHNIALQLIRPSPEDGGQEQGIECDLQVRAFPLPLYASVHIGVPCRTRLINFWREARPDVAYIATEGPLGWAALSAARRLSIPAVSGFHTNFDKYTSSYSLGWLRNIVHRGLRHFHNRSQATLVPTLAQAEQLTQQGYRNVKVLGRGIDCAVFSPRKRDASLRGQWGAADHQPVALYVGRLAAEKNVTLLAESIHAMQKVQPNLVPVMVGDGPQRPQLERLLPQAVFTGPLRGEALARHYASADIFLFPSQSETYGNVIPEAMASGLAIVAFRYAAAAELIRSGYNGRLAELEDTAGFIDMAVELCQHPAMYARLGRAARESVEDLGWSRIGEMFLDYLLAARQTEQQVAPTFRV